MSAIVDFLNKVLGKQDETLSTLSAIKAEVEAQKSLAAEKDKEISRLQARVTSLEADHALEKDRAEKAESALSAEKQAHAQTAKSVEAKASLKAKETIEQIGHAPVTQGANEKPAEPEKKDLSHLKGRARVAAAINAELGNRK